MATVVVTSVEEEEEKINVVLNRESNNNESMNGADRLDGKWLDYNEDVALVSVLEWCQQ